jgi:hypothetical protein
VGINRICILGHSGIGKSNLAALFKVAGWEPYRVRVPRDAEDAAVCKSPDEFKKLREEAIQKGLKHKFQIEAGGDLEVYDDCSIFKVRGKDQYLTRSSTSNRRGVVGGGFASVSRQAARSQRTQNETGAMMRMTNTADRCPRFTSSRRLATSARREKSRFRRLGQNGREHALVASVRALDGPDPAVISDPRDCLFTLRVRCCLFPRLDTFVQILI